MANLNIDEMLEKAGDFGCYQIFLMILFSIVNVVCAFHYFSQTFISVIPEHWCNSSEFWSLDSLNDSVVKGIRDHLVDLKDKSCARYQRDDIPVGDEWLYGNETQTDSTWSEVACDNGWIYNRDNGFESIVSELNWVCEEDWKPALGQSTFFVGSVIGTMALGVLSDRIGRLPVLSIAHALAFIGNMCTVFANSLPAFASCRFISGLATDCNFMMMYIIVMEYVRPSMRTFGLNLCIGVFYCLGCVTVPLVAMALSSWRLFLLITTLPIAIVVCYYFVLVLMAALLAAPVLSQHHGGLQQYQSGQQGGHYQVQPQQQHHVQQAPQHHYGGHHEQEHYDDHPKYEFHYKVEDEHTGDYKEQQESRDGDVVKGFYWLLDADGYRRHVEYVVDGKSGFQAKVTREPTGHAPVPPRQHQPAQHAPVQHAPAPVHYAPAPVHHAPAPVHHAPAPVHRAPAPAPVHHQPIHYQPNYHH